MSTIINNELSIWEATEKIKNGKFIIPAFQRQFVWNMEQIEKLWDSILLDYPISNFLFWHVDDSNTTWDTYFMSFLERVTFNSRLQADADNNNYSLSNIDTRYNDTAILDGQQRLTALYISLFGDLYIRPKNSRKSYGGGIIAKLFIELNKNKISFDDEEYNSKKFDIKFSTKVGMVSPTCFEIRKILDLKDMSDEDRSLYIEKAISKVPKDSKNYARNILNSLYNKIFIEKLIRYTEIIDMKQDDALEMFVRFNSGGKQLKKSDITMSILEAYWPQARQEFGKILIDDFYGFGSDFIVRTALMLYGDVIKSTISKSIATDLMNNWGDFKKALHNLSSLLKELNIDIKRFINGWNVLLPIIYMIYYNPNEYKDYVDDIRAYIIRSIFFSYFQSGTTAKLQQMKTNMNSFNSKITIDMLDQMVELAVTRGKLDDLLSVEKGSRTAGEILYYLSRHWLNNEYKYEQDHLHPYDRFNESKPLNVSIESWTRWKSLRNKLPNLQLLEGRSNGSKNDMPLIDYYNQKNELQKEEFITNSFIPTNISLELSSFEEFYQARKQLLEDKIKNLLK